MPLGSLVDVTGLASMNLIVACARNRVMGREGRLPWDLPEDWAHFRRLTQGGLLVMGRICFEEMQALNAVTPDRDFWVLSQSRTYDYDHVRVFKDMDILFDELKGVSKSIWICGGEQLYERAIPVADTLYMTRVEHPFEGDRYFPDTGNRFKHIMWKRAASYRGLSYTFLKYC